MKADKILRNVFNPFGKDEVTGSNPVISSKNKGYPQGTFYFWFADSDLNVSVKKTVLRTVFSEPRRCTFSDAHAAVSEMKHFGKQNEGYQLHKSSVVYDYAAFILPVRLTGFEGERIVLNTSRTGKQKT